MQETSEWQQQTETDVVIVGQGVAGLVLSVLLGRAGIKHVVLSRGQGADRPALAETLPPSALKLLQSMGLRELFESCSTRTFGYHSLWGTQEVADTHFFSHHPFNYGLKLDKPALLQSLQAEAPGCVVACEGLTGVEDTGRGIKVTYRAGKSWHVLHARYVVDATGRSRAVVHKLGIASEHTDRQVALSCYVPLTRHPRLKHGVYTEAFEGGWGMVSVLDEVSSVMTLFAERDSPLLQLMKQYTHWAQILSETRYLKYFLAKEPLCPVWGHEANSSRATQMSGPAHLAIGDAALAFDPLASHGISNALFTAEAASKVLTKALRHDPTAVIEAYDHMLNRVFAQYVQQRNQLHGAVAVAGSTH
ncbi:NAD(P)/FAD-dependent oxidoreductase [Roseivirga sp. BDSF3-8]|uniref:NAD(P)/FAD-dependent oxidoreductase n=1 Tax=Roseivirga sp. BDSF3-8 TaxID=3241598 RepID=UPI0035322DD7